jgi:uncharacterized protein
MIYLQKIFSILSLFLFIIIQTDPGYLRSQDLPSPPERRVTDFADVLAEADEYRLDSILRTYEDTTSNQLIVAIFQNAQGFAVEDFTIRLAEKWLVGQKERDNGIILAIFMDERKIRVEVGYGLEDMVTDAVAIQIAQNVISPEFKNGNYRTGIFEGVDALMRASAGKYEGLGKKETNGENKIRVPYVFLVFLLLFFLSLLKRRRYSSVSSRGYRTGGPFWWGGFGGSRGGGSGGGGFGGGGFSGGGGSFGGGGATGSW